MLGSYAIQSALISLFRRGQGALQMRFALIISFDMWNLLPKHLPCKLANWFSELLRLAFEIHKMFVPCLRLEKSAFVWYFNFSFACCCTLSRHVSTLDCVSSGSTYNFNSNLIYIFWKFETRQTISENRHPLVGLNKEWKKHEYVENWLKNLQASVWHFWSIKRRLLQRSIWINMHPPAPLQNDRSELRFWLWSKREIRILKNFFKGATPFQHFFQVFSLIWPIKRISKKLTRAWQTY